MKKRKKERKKAGLSLWSNYRMNKHARMRKTGNIALSMDSGSRLVPIESMVSKGFILESVNESNWWSKPITFLSILHQGIKDKKINTSNSDDIQGCSNYP